MAKPIVLDDEEFERQLLAARQRFTEEHAAGLHASSVRYHTRSRRFVLELSNGYLFGVPVDTLPDLAEATHDRLLAEVRKRLRQEHGFPPPGQKLDVAAVFSPEKPVTPEPPACAVAGQGTVPPRLNCEWGYGAATFVTGTFGFAAAGWVVRQVAGGR